ncbi:MAG: hypothetical protein JWR37_5760 [Mycobacterium sp.]|nr:hypothetical protein [Mycobacterium sp.]
MVDVWVRSRQTVVPCLATVPDQLMKTLNLLLGVALPGGMIGHFITLTSAI